MGIYHRLVQRWRDADITVNSPLACSEIAKFEVKRRIDLPGDFKSYLSVADGMQDGQTDENVMSFLSLKLMDENTQWQPLEKKCVNLVFAEFLIFSHVYALRIPTGGGNSAVVARDGTHELHLADSFELFVESYLADPEEIAYCWAKASSK